MDSQRADLERYFLDQPEVYRQILDAIADMVLVKGAESRILWANKAFRDYYGMSNEQLVSIVDATFSPVDFTAQYVRDDLHVFTTGEVLDIPDEPVTRHDGVVQSFHTVKSPLRDQDGQVRMTVGVSRNTTEQKRIREELARHHERLEHLVEERTAELARVSDRLSTVLSALVEGIVATDAASRVELLNPAAERLTGCNANEARTRKVSEILALTPENAGSDIDEAGLIQLAEARARTTGHLTNRDGSTRLVEVQATQLLADDGGHHGAVLVLRDIGIEREVAEQRNRRQKLESVGLLAGGIAHDFNNVLAAILASVSVARDRLTSGGPIDELLENAEHACTRAQALTTQLLTFAKGGAPVKRVIHLGPLVREAADLALAGSAVCLDFHCEAGVLAVEADEGQIAQAVGNIVLNARQAMPAGGRLQIRIANREVNPGNAPCLPPGRCVRITASDSGVGIAAECLPRIFDPYYTTRPGGTGLGLASVHSIIERHGGHVAVASTVGSGTTFTIDLPAVDRAAEPAEPAEPAPAPPRAAPRRLLVLDDDASVRKAMAAMLSIDGHSAVMTAKSDEAFAEFDAARSGGSAFDGVFVDLTMPGDLGGAEVIRLLRERDPRVRLVVMSGYSEDPVMAHATEFGLVGALQKPFGLDRLREMVALV